MKKEKLFTKADAVLLVVLLVLGLGSPLLLQKKPSENAKVMIYCEGELMESWDLDQDTAFGFIAAKNENEKNTILNLTFLSSIHEPSEFDNYIVVENGTVEVTYANCHGKDCVRTGKISREGQVIACLPHKLLITISSGEDEMDAVAR